MSTIQSFDLESHSYEEIPNGRTRKKSGKRDSFSRSPYGTKGPVNPRQAWLNSMNKGQGFTNTRGSYTNFGGYSSPTKALPNKVKPVNPGSLMDSEEMYDEIQRLKGVIAAYDKEKGLMKTQLVKLEKEIVRKDKALDETLSLSVTAYNGGASEKSFKTTGDSVAVLNMKQKCHKYEKMLKEKDSEISSLKSNTKSVRLQELEIMTETYYEEIKRLTDILDNQTGITSPRASTPISKTDKERILEDKVEDLESKITQLEINNSTLKKLLLKNETKLRLDQGLTASIGNLEKEKEMQAKEVFDGKLKLDELRTKTRVLEDEIAQLKSVNTKQKESLEKLREDKDEVQIKYSNTDGEKQAQRMVIKRLNKTIREHENEIERLLKQIDRDKVEHMKRLAEKEEELELLQNEISNLEAHRKKDLELETKSDTKLEDAWKQKQSYETAEKITMKREDGTRHKNDSNRQKVRLEDGGDPRLKAPEHVTTNDNTVLTVQFEEKEMEMSAPEKQEVKLTNSKSEYLGGNDQKINARSNAHAYNDEKEHENAGLSGDKSIFLKEREFPDSESEMSRSSKEQDSTLAKSEAAATFEMMVQDEKINSDKIRSIAVNKDDHKSIKNTKSIKAETTEKKSAHAIKTKPKQPSKKEIDLEKRKRERRQQEMLEDAAARRIQYKYREHKVVQSVYTIQRLLRGHQIRTEAMDKEAEVNTAILQTAFKSYSTRQQHINELNKENENRDNKEASNVVVTREDYKSNNRVVLPGRDDDDTPQDGRRRRNSKKTVERKDHVTVERKDHVTSDDEDDLVMM